MAFQGSFLLCLFLLLANVLVLIELSLAANVPSHEITLPFNRTIFPSEFIFGASSSTYQYEGAWNEDGKGPSICDTFTHTHPEKILDHSNGDVALDFYHRYKDDLKLAKFEGLDAFRFSISWTRILPHKRGCSYGQYHLPTIPRSWVRVTKRAIALTTGSKENQRGGGLKKKFTFVVPNIFH